MAAVGCWCGPVRFGRRNLTIAGRLALFSAVGICEREEKRKDALRRVFVLERAVHAGRLWPVCAVCSRDVDLGSAHMK